MFRVSVTGLFICIASFIYVCDSTCVLESDFGFTINCAFKKSGLFRVRNLGGIKAHVGLGFSVGDELGFGQSLTNLDPSRRRSVSVSGGPVNAIAETQPTTAKQEKRGKQNRLIVRQPSSPPPQMPASAGAANLAAVKAAMANLQRRVNTYPHTTMQPIIVPSAPAVDKPVPRLTIAKPLPMNVPPFRPLPPKNTPLAVLPIATTRRSPQISQAKGPGLAYTNPDPHGVNDLASQIYPVYSPNKKLDDYNSISGYGEESYKYTKDDINTKISQIAQAGNISMEAVEAAILLRQQQLLNQYANVPMPTTTTTTTTTQAPPVFKPEPTFPPAVTQKHKRYPMATGSAKVMNAPREYYPIGYEKNYDDKFESKVELPETSFYCGDQKYFPGLYADENLGCMVFHVCALTDDGLVMKSFLCPESTLFDQTILKCNWWFYVDCKTSKSLYDTNIPVSKSYQLMKALTFFSSYKKENGDDGRGKSPEDIEGVKEAITILENQNNPKFSPSYQQENIEIITAQPVTGSSAVRRTSRYNTSNHRMDRNFKVNSTSVDSSKSEDNNVSSSKQINTVVSNSMSVEVNSGENKTSSEKTMRRRKNSFSQKHATINFRSASTNSPKTSATTPRPKVITAAVELTTPSIVMSTVKTEITTVKPETTPKVEITTEKIEPVKAKVTERIKPKVTKVRPSPDVQSTTAQPQTITESAAKAIPKAAAALNALLKNTDSAQEINDELYSSEPEMFVKPIVRSTTLDPNNKGVEANQSSTLYDEDTKLARPTPTSELVGQYPTPTATIAALDQAILGRSSGNVPRLSVAKSTQGTVKASYTISDTEKQERT